MLILWKICGIEKINTFKELIRHADSKIKRTKTTFKSLNLYYKDYLINKYEILWTLFRARCDAAYCQGIWGNRISNLKSVW